MAGPRTATNGQAFRLWWPIRGSGRAFDMLVSSAVINVLSLAMPLALLQIYDRVVPNRSSETLILLVLGVAGALLLEFLLRLCRSYVNGWMGARFEHAVGCRAVGHLLDSRVSAFDRVGLGAHIQRVNALHALREFYGGQTLTAFCDLPFALLFIAVVAYLAGPLALVPLILLVLFAAAAGLTGTRVRRALAGRIRSDDRRFNFLMEALGGVHTVKALALENQMLRRYERLQETSADAQFEVALNSTSTINLGALFSQLTLVLVVSFGAVMVIDGRLTVGALVACTIMSSRAMQPLQRAVGVWTRFQTARLAEGQLQDLFDMPSEAPTTRRALPKLVGNIAFEATRFRYPASSTDLLSDVSASIGAGETVAVTGASGSGKTTLLYLMAGLHRPTAGTVRVDGHDIAELDPSDLRRRVTYVPHRAFMFAGTVRENLTMFRPELDSAALQISEVLGLDDVVARLPSGYETRIGAGARDPITPCLRQQIAIARALAGRPRIVLFDEANAALDRTADARLHALLGKLHGHLTVVMVTHRPSMLTLADRVLLIRDGAVTEQDRDVSRLTAWSQADSTSARPDTDAPSRSAG